MQIRLTHKTSYHFDRPVPYALHRLRMFPKSSAGQKVHQWQTEVVGGAKQAEYEDHHHNRIELIRSAVGVEEIVINCSGLVETDPNHHGVIGQHGGNVPLGLFLRQSELTRPGPKIQEIAREFAPRTSGDHLALLHDLSAAILAQCPYQTGATHVGTSAEEAASAGAGVCQDHAHIFISVARALDIPARYVSGYLYMTDREAQDAGHGWAEGWVEGLGWTGFDISNGISPDERYIRVATGFDYRDAAPVSSMSFGAKDTDMTVELQVSQQ